MGTNPYDEALRQELLRMQERDQEMRMAISERYQLGTPISAEDQAWWESVDAGNTQRMREIIAQLAEVRAWGGQFVVPGRDLTIIS